MPFKTLIKASSITNLTDARFFSSFQVAWIGFNFDPLALNSVAAEQAEEIIHWITGPSIVGEFSNRSNEEIAFIVERLKLKGVQVPVQTDISDIFPENDITRFKEMFISPDAIPFAIPDHGDMDYLVLQISDVPMPLEMEKDMQEFILNASQSYPLILSGNFTPENVNEVLNRFKPVGINIYGSEEIQTGMKEFHEIADLFEQLEVQE